MSSRPIADKKRKRVARAFHVTPTSYVNLVNWLVLRKHAPTNRLARKMILDARVTYQGEAMGIGYRTIIGKDQKLAQEPFVQPMILADFTDGLEIHDEVA